MSRIIASVITFNPDINLLKKNIDSYIDYVDEIIIVDNFSKNRDELIQFKKIGVNIINNTSNLGIAKALNIALNYGNNKNYDLLLTMDQDSYFEKDSFKFLKSGFNISSDVAIVCPTINDVKIGNISKSNKNWEELFTTITSGSLCSISKLVKIGGFNISLYIDYVDVDLCLRLNKKKLIIIRSNDSILNHKLGNSKIYKFLNINFISTNHNKMRRYYYARNKVYIYKKYFFIFPLFVIRDYFSFLKTLLIIVLFEKEKQSKIIYTLKGIYDGVFKI
jgi:rhamnosyltransferase